MIGRTLAGAAAILALSTTLAAAAPAALERSSNVRAGPGTNYPVIATLPAGAVVDVAGCTGSWCQVDTNAGAGYVARSLLAFGGGGGGAVAVAPGYGYYGDDYYDEGYAYGPSVGVYVGPNYRYRHRQGWRGQDGRGNWAGRSNIDRGNWAGRSVDRGSWTGRANVDRGTWSGNRGGSAGVSIPSQRQSGATIKDFGGRSTVGAGSSVGARGSVGGGSAISGGRGGSGGGGGASVGGRGGFGLDGRP